MVWGRSLNALSCFSEKIKGLHFSVWPFFLCAPCRAHPLGGASPLHKRPKPKTVNAIKSPNAIPPFVPKECRSGCERSEFPDNSIGRGSNSGCQVKPAAQPDLLTCVVCPGRASNGFDIKLTRKGGSVKHFRPSGFKAIISNAVDDEYEAADREPFGQTDFFF